MTKPTTIEVLSKVLDTQLDCDSAMYADAREALRQVFSLVAAAEALNGDPATLLELQAALGPFQVRS